MQWQHNPQMYKLTSRWLEEDVAREKAETEEQEPLNDKRVRSHIEKLLQQIETVRLEPSPKKDSTQERLLHDAKQRARQLIRETLTTVRNYMQAIQQLEATKRRGAESYSDIKDYIADLKQRDEARSRSHEALISRLTTTTRFISHTFGRIDKTAQEHWEKERESRELPILHVERIQLPPHILCPTSVNLNDRVSIGEWAIHVYDSLTVLEKKLSPSKEES